GEVVQGKCMLRVEGQRVPEVLQGSSGITGVLPGQATVDKIIRLARIEQDGGVEPRNGAVKIPEGHVDHPEVVVDQWRGTALGCQDLVGTAHPRSFVKMDGLWFAGG